MKLNRSLMLTVIVAGTSTALLVGCAKKGAAKTAGKSSSVLDVGPAPAPSSPVFTSTPTQPQFEPVTAPPPPPAAAAEPAKIASAGGSYTVKKGDTLFSIARAKYGNGNQWQKIASANPGLQPSKLRVGQTITLP